MRFAPAGICCASRGGSVEVSAALGEAEQLKKLQASSSKAESRRMGEFLCVVARYCAARLRLAALVQCRLAAAAVVSTSR